MIVILPVVPSTVGVSLFDLVVSCVRCRYGKCLLLGVRKLRWVTVNRLSGVMFELTSLGYVRVPVTGACTLGPFNRVSIELLIQLISERTMSRGRTIILIRDGPVLNN